MELSTGNADEHDDRQDIEARRLRLHRSSDWKTRRLVPCRLNTTASASRELEFSSDPAAQSLCRDPTESDRSRSQSGGPPMRTIGAGPVRPSRWPAHRSIERHSWQGLWFTAAWLHTSDRLVTSGATCLRRRRLLKRAHDQIRVGHQARRGRVDQHVCRRSMSSPESCWSSGSHPLTHTPASSAPNPDARTANGDGRRDHVVRWRLSGRDRPDRCTETQGHGLSARLRRRRYFRPPSGAKIRVLCATELSSSTGAELSSTSRALVGWPLVPFAPSVGPTTRRRSA